MPRGDVPISEDGDASVHTEKSGVWMNRAYYLGVGRPGSVPFVSHRPGACCWLCMCGGRLDCWCPLIGSGL